MLPRMHDIHMAKKVGFSRCKYYFRPTVDDRSTFDSCLHVPQQFQPEILLLNTCLNPAVNRNQTIVISSWCSALSEVFKSFTRKYSFVTTSPIRFQEPASLCVCGSSQDFSCHSILCSPPSGVICPPKSPCNDLLRYFSIMRRPYVVGRNNNSRTLSQQPDKESNQKPSAKQLHDVKQIMIRQVIHFIKLCL